MKKVLFTAMAAVAMFAMVACNNNKTQEAVAEDTTATEQCVKQCDKHQCADTCMCGEECAAAECEGCPNHGTENCCKAKATVEGQACEQQCQKAEGEKSCKAEGKECEKKCEKAQ